MENFPRYEGGDEFIDQGAGKPPAAGSSDGGADKITVQNTESAGDVPAPETESNRGADSGAVHLIRRVVFGMGDHARSKAGNPRAFVEWIDGGLVSHRTRARDLLGDDEIVSRFLEELKQVAQRATAGELVAAVDEVCAAFEMGV